MSDPPRDEPALRSELDWPALLGAVARTGAAFAARAVTEPLRHAVLAEVAGLPFEDVEPVVGGRVRQDAAAFVIEDHRLGNYPALHTLREQLVRAVHDHAARSSCLASWQPTEACVQLYRPGALGVSPHLDHKRYAMLVAVVTITGTADFTLCRNRSGEPIRTWTAGPGSLALLRGPGLTGDQDGRPLHAVGGPTSGDRVSVGIRMDARQTSNT